VRTQRILTRIRVWKYGWRVQITSEVRDKVDFIKISGRMVHDGSLVRLREHVLYELQSGIRRFVVDISEVPHLDSSGCGEVISAHTSILRANGALALAPPNECAFFGNGQESPKFSTFSILWIKRDSSSVNDKELLKPAHFSNGRMNGSEPARQN
jgi:hypothetical protein